ncbi:MAG: fructose-1,6-bisphosphatase [Bacteroidaceae bacterium]|nr:fructose-1,6-bisphosphatase [Bacteroidaceae bacterium]
MSIITKADKKKLDLRYLSLLAHDYPNVPAVTTEIINLEAILHLPKPTEHFMADLHGENEAFHHILRNASGDIKRKVREHYGNTLRDKELKDLCTLIYYPEQKLELIKKEESDLDDYYQTTLNQLVSICRDVSSKYTRSKVRKSLPEEFAYIIEELLHETSDGHNKQEYFSVIIRSIIETKRADQFIIALCDLIKRLAVDQLHILGDIFDRGPGAHLILDTLCRFHHLDIEWGNHDMLWMGAAAGNSACLASVLRLSLRYANTRTSEDGYGISLVSLATFAMEVYGDDPCELFLPRGEDDALIMTEKELNLMAKMHKAISVIQFKLEGQLYRQHPEWKLSDRSLLEKIDFEKGVAILGDKEYKLIDTNFPTVNPRDPLALTPEEQELMNRLHHSFEMSDRFKKHIRCLLKRGGMYGIYNSNLLFHASIPLTENGELKEVVIEGETFQGKTLLDKIDELVRQAFDVGATKEEQAAGRDYIWYLWCGPDSPLYDKSRMATFERYFIAEKETHQEQKGWYYTLRNSEEVCDRILDDFGVKGNHRHIINGHVPVHVSRGENPVKANGKLMVIDGGFAKAYHDTTGIAGYTLVYHSRGFQLVQHEPFSSTDEAIRQGTDIRSTMQIVEMTGNRIMVGDTDKGEFLRTQIVELKRLLYAYHKGIIKESK